MAQIPQQNQQDPLARHLFLQRLIAGPQAALDSKKVSPVLGTPKELDNTSQEAAAIAGGGLAEPQGPLVTDGPQGALVEQEVAQQAIAPKQDVAVSDLSDEEYRVRVDAFRRDMTQDGFSQKEIEAEVARKAEIRTATIAVGKGFDIDKVDKKIQQAVFLALGATGVDTDTTEVREPAGEKERMFKDASEAAKDALITLRGGDVETGPVTTRLQKLGEKLPGAQATQGGRFRSQLAVARTAVRNALLGGAISTQEAASLEDALPNATDQEKIAEQKLEEFITQFGGRFGVEVPEGGEVRGDPVSATVEYFKEGLPVAAKGLSLLPANISDLIKGDFESIGRRSEAFAPEVERLKRLDTNARLEVGSIIAFALLAPVVLPKMIGLGKTVIGSKGGKIGLGIGAGTGISGGILKALGAFGGTVIQGQ